MILVYEICILGSSRSEIINELNERGFKAKVGTMFKVISIHSILTHRINLQLIMQCLQELKVDV